MGDFEMFLGFELLIIKFPSGPSFQYWFKILLFQWGIILNTFYAPCISRPTTRDHYSVVCHGLSVTLYVLACQEEVSHMPLGTHWLVFYHYWFLCWLYWNILWIVIYYLILYVYVHYYYVVSITSVLYGDIVYILVNNIWCCEYCQSVLYLFYNNCLIIYWNIHYYDRKLYPDEVTV